MKKADLTSLIHTTKTLIIIAKKAMKDGKVELAVAFYFRDKRLYVCRIYWPGGLVVDPAGMGKVMHG